MVPSAFGSSLTLSIRQQDAEEEKDRAGDFSQKHRLVGTVVGPDRRPRIVQVDDYRMEIAPEGNWLVFSNEDRPGVIAGVCAELGGAGINIGNFVLVGCEWLVVPPHDTAV